MSQLWPQEFRATVERAFGGSLDNTTYAVVNRRVEHAFDVWRRRYQMNPEQELYAWRLLTYAVERAAASVERQKRQVSNLYLYRRKAVASEMEKIVNAPRGHEGFKARAELVDIRKQLAEALA